MVDEESVCNTRRKPRQPLLLEQLSNMRKNFIKPRLSHPPFLDRPISIPNRNHEKSHQRDAKPKLVKKSFVHICH